MLNLRNEFIMAPIKLGYSDGNGFVNQKHIDFYRERTKHIGAVILEPLFMSSNLREIPTQLGIDSDDKISGLKQLNEIIHKNGSKSIAHLNHPGRMANPKIPGNVFISSTNKACENGGAVPQKMNESDMESVTELFVQSAKRAEAADFDFLELQYGHGYLFAQFFSPAVNDRTDEYGGSFENRIKFPLAVLDAVQKEVSLPIVIRISGDELIENGFHLSEMVQLVKHFEKRKVAAVHVTAGSVCSTPPWFFQHMFIPKGKTWELAANIQKETKLPVIFVGRINTYEDIEKIKNEYNGKFLAIGRALVADANFVGKYQKKVEGNYRPCLSCSEGCLGGVKSGKGLHCLVNPLVGNFELQEIQPVSKRKKIAIVGGGLAGMEAALDFTLKGYQVDLFEKNDLGGQFNLAYLPPKKESLKKLVDYYIAELNRNNIKIIKKEATPDDLIGKYDEAILATGAVPAIPPIKGLTKYYWADFLKKEDQLPQNEKIVIIGGGLIGIEMASKLVDKGNEIIVVEMLSEIAAGMEMLERKLTLAKLKSKNVKIYLESKVTEIDGNKIKMSQHEKEIVLENIDKIIVATGMKSYHPLKEKLEGKIPLHLIGDAQKVAKAQDAILSAYVIASSV